MYSEEMTTAELRTSKTGTAPMVSIGLAVYNGENYLALAIESVLNQTFTDFELIISDNASTDHTAEICASYAARDNRIRYHRNSSNIGATRNENLTFAISRGKYFRWLGHDDLCAPDQLAECVAVLENDHGIVLCHSEVVEIDDDGTQTGIGSWCNASSYVPHERFRNVIKMDHRCNEFYGVIRSVTFRQLREQQPYVDSDRTLLADLALRGRFHRINKGLFFRRIHSKKSTVLYPSWRERMVWYDPSYETKIVLPFWMQFIDYVKRLIAAPLPAFEKMKCFAAMFTWLREGHGRSMVKDVLLATQKLLLISIARLVPGRRTNHPGHR